MTTYSKNKKLNKVLNDIESQLLSIHDTQAESISEIKHYMHEFPYLSRNDYNIAEYGNVLIYHDDIRELYKEYKSLENASDTYLWIIYKRQVGYVARCLRKGSKNETN